MKNRFCRYIVFFIALVALLCMTASASAKIEWEFLSDIPVSETPKDIVLNKDGNTIYILGTENIHIYSLREKKITDTIPVKNNFSEIALSPEGDHIFLTSAKNKKVSIIEISEIYDLKIGNSAVIGNRNAKVSVVAFLDYQ